MPSEPERADALSPAVRRLVRQYDLDITGVYGSGPAGKIRVGDIIGMLDGRAEPKPRTGEEPIRAERAARFATSGTPSEARVSPAKSGEVPVEDSAATDAAYAAPMTTVFECDVSRVLSHRKRERQGDVELLIASYFVAACLDALRAVPEIVTASPESTPDESTGFRPRLGVLVATTDGSLRRALVDTIATPLNERVRAVDARVRTSGDDDLRPAQVLIHYYGASGSLLATPTAIGSGHVGSIGIGRVRREIVVRTVDGQEAPRVAALCYLTLTFRPERIALERANRFVAEWVRVLEQWPVEPASTG
jgi:2-oxoglutarate dehydrogenase E2 component (dihydrolipoamide succinyltransferase)